MTALITGASGFIGWHLASALRQRGQRVLGLVRHSSQVQQLEPLGVELVRGDVTDLASLEAACRDVDVVFHLAGLTKALRRETMDEVNAEGSRNVASACADNRVKTLICVSSLAAAGPSKDGQPLLESDTPAPVSNYGRSKLAGENSVRPFRDRVGISIVRPAIVIGEYDPVSLEMFQSIHRFRVHVLPGFRRLPYSVIHAADLAELLIRVADVGERLSDAERGCGVYFAEGDTRPTYAEMGDMIGAAIDRRFLKLSLGPRVLRGFAAVADVAAKAKGRALYFSSDKVREATTGPWICSAEKARTQLGFSVARPLYDRFAQAGQWYQAHGWL